MRQREKEKKKKKNFFWVENIILYKVDSVAEIKSS